MDGRTLDDRTLARQVPIIVQIENNPIARPPSGLNRADLVIEAPVEGDTTRFMAVFMCRPQVDAMVGPVRSVRYFNADLFQQLRGLTLHFGGAAKVIANLDSNGVPRVNGLTTGWYFFQRAGVWPAPHNVFLDIDAARHEMDEGGLQDVARIERHGRAPFKFRPDAHMPRGPARQQHRPCDLQLLALRLGLESRGSSLAAIRRRRGELRRRHRRSHVGEDGRRPGRPPGHPARRARPGWVPAPLSVPRRRGDRRPLRGRSRLRRALGAGRCQRRHDLDLRRQRQAGQAPTGQGVVGDRSAGERISEG